MSESKTDNLRPRNSPTSRRRATTDPQFAGDYLTSPLSVGSCEVRARGSSFAAESFRVAVNERENNLCEHTVQQGVAMHFQFRVVWCRSPSPPSPPPIPCVCSSPIADAAHCGSGALATHTVCPPSVAATSTRHVSAWSRWPRSAGEAHPRLGKGGRRRVRGGGRVG